MSDDNATITVRVIRSLEHRNWKPVVIRNCNLRTTTLSQLKVMILVTMKECGFPPPFTSNMDYYDSIKLETNPETNNSKSSDSLINRATPMMSFSENSDGMERTLSGIRISNESEVSIFNLKDYRDYSSL